MIGPERSGGNLGGGVMGLCTKKKTRNSVQEVFARTRLRGGEGGPAKDTPPPEKEENMEEKYFVKKKSRGSWGAGGGNS